MINEILFALAIIIFILSIGMHFIWFIFDNSKIILKIFPIIYSLIIVEGICFYFRNMKLKIDVEFYTNWVAKFRGESSNFGYCICGLKDCMMVVQK